MKRVLPSAAATHGRGIRPALLLLCSLLLPGCGGGASSPTPTPVTPAEPSAVVDLTVATFESEVLRVGRVAMVEFYSTRCAACLAMAPTVERIAQDYGNHALVARVEANSYLELTLRYEVAVVPTFVFFKDGTAVERVEPPTDYQNLTATLEAVLSS